MLDGTSVQSIDGCKFDVGKHDLLFSLPYQIQEFAINNHGTDYYKLGFDENCLSRLPIHYPFLLDPHRNQKISLSAPVANRIGIIFNLLQSLLSHTGTDPQLILAHLNSLLTEINTAYFASTVEPNEGRQAKFIRFKVLVEANLTNHLTIKDIAAELTLSTEVLYQIVKYYSGLPPKKFINNRLMLEARRRLNINKYLSVKELSFELGFNDPDYFSRLFKKTSGKTIAGFLKDLS